jgi:hypothetical protein
MYTIRPRSAGVIGLAGPPHDDITIAIIVTTASFTRLDDLKWPKMVCTDELRGWSRFRILAKDFRHASDARRSKQRHELVHRYFYCPDNCPKSAAVKRRVHGNGHRIAALADQAHVTTLLSHLPATEFSECFDTIG